MHTIPIKYFYGGPSTISACHTQAPQLSLSAGSGLQVVLSSLITGFGETNISGITIDANGLATATCTSHGYLKTPLVILVTGCDQTALNGEWELKSFTSTTLVFDAKDSGLRSTTITGTIKIKVAPLGWETPFGTTSNISVVRSKDPLSRRAFLRIDDTDNTNTPSSIARMGYFRGYESMSSIDDSRNLSISY